MHFVKVNNNGLLSFGKAVSTYTPRSFPLGDGCQLIAPYWADVDTREAGTVWFREVNDSALLNRIGGNLRRNIASLSFQPTSALIVTWESVGYYSAHFDLVSTYIGIISSVTFLIPSLPTYQCYTRKNIQYW